MGECDKPAGDISFICESVCVYQKIDHPRVTKPSKQSKHIKNRIMDICKQLWLQACLIQAPIAPMAAHPVRRKPLQPPGAQRLSGGLQSAKWKMDRAKFNKRHMFHWKKNMENH